MRKMLLGKSIKSIAELSCVAFFPVVLACFLFSLVCAGQTASWRDLKPLVSTREDVEAVLGKPIGRFADFDRFRNELGKFNVWYSACTYTIKRGRSENAIPIGRLERLIFLPKLLAPFSKYSAETNDYKKIDSPGAVGQYLYLSKAEDVIFETAILASGEEIVLSIEYSVPDLPPEAKCEQRPKQGQ